LGYKKQYLYGVTMKKILLFGLLLMSLTTLVYSQVQITDTSIYYTADQMFLANEINESGEPFAEALGYNLDDLDPFILNQPDSISYTLGIENYEYSRYQLGTIITRSGMGLHMMWAPVIMEMAAMEPAGFDGSFTGEPNGFNEDDELMKNIMHFSMLANHEPPGNPWPQFAEFVSGDPNLPQSIDPINFAWNDFSTLRWDRSLMDKNLNPAAMGQTLMKQYLWAQDMLGGYHDLDGNGIDPTPDVSPDFTDSPNFDPNNNIYFGGNDLDGFVGQVLTAESINKVKFVISSLAYDGSTLGSVDPATYDPMNGISYFPHLVEVTEGSVDPNLPPQATSFSITDPVSYLHDQNSFLWGTLNFVNMMDPDNSSSPAHLAYHHVFDGDPFPAAMSQTGMPGPFDLMKGTSKVIFMNLMSMHYNMSEGTFVDQSELLGGIAQPGNEISAFNAGYMLVILKLVAEEFSGTPLETMAADALSAQANFVINQLSDQNGRFYNGYTIDAGADISSTLVENQAAAIRGLYAAYQATNDNIFLQAANDGYQYLIDNFYVSPATAFRTEEGNDMAIYTPLKIAALSGALREANMVGEFEGSPLIYTRFFKKVANAMQLSEGEPSGETGSDSDGDGIPFIPEQPDNLPPVFATEATLDLTFTSADDNDIIISALGLNQNYPNPFNPSTTISFSINTKSIENAELVVYNMKGQRVKKLISESLPSGSYTAIWNGTDEQDKSVSSGLYLYKLKVGNYTQTKKMIMIK